MGTINGRFEIQREIARGGMATVYLANARLLGREVAVKMLSAEMASERFRREIQMTARLVHPGIVAVFDTGHAGTRQYYVMPYVRGETLRDLLRREKKSSASSSCWSWRGISRKRSRMRTAGPRPS